MVGLIDRGTEELKKLLSTHSTHSSLSTHSTLSTKSEFVSIMKTFMKLFSYLFVIISIFAIGYFGVIDFEHWIIIALVSLVSYYIGKEHGEKKKINLLKNETRRNIR